MARTGLSQSDVATAYDALREAGIHPSIRNIRERLGNTGSLKTIADHVRALRTERWQSPGPALPDSLLQSLVDGAGELWQELADAADAHIEANNAQCLKQIADMQVERDEAAGACAAMRDALSAHKAHISTLEKQLAQADSQRCDVESKLSAALEAGEQERSRADCAEATLERRTQERDRAQRDRETAQQRVEVAAQQCESLSAEHALLLTERDETIRAMKIEHEAANGALTQAMSTVEHWQAEKKRWTDDRATLANEIDRLQEAAHTQTETARNLREKISSLTEEAISWRSRHEASTFAFTTATEQQATVIKTLSEQMSVLIEQTDYRNEQRGR